MEAFVQETQTGTFGDTSAVFSPTNPTPSASYETLPLPLPPTDLTPPFPPPPAFARVVLDLLTAESQEIINSFQVLDADATRQMVGVLLDEKQRRLRSEVVRALQQRWTHASALLEVLLNTETSNAIDWSTAADYVWNWIEEINQYTSSIDNLISKVQMVVANDNNATDVDWAYEREGISRDAAIVILRLLAALKRLVAPPPAPRAVKQHYRPMSARPALKLNTTMINPAWAGQASSAITIAPTNMLLLPQPNLRQQRASWTAAPSLPSIPEAMGSHFTPQMATFDQRYQQHAVYPIQRSTTSMSFHDTYMATPFTFSDSSLPPLSDQSTPVNSEHSGQQAWPFDSPETKEPHTMTPLNQQYLRKPRRLMNSASVSDISSIVDSYFPSSQNTNMTTPQIGANNFNSSKPSNRRHSLGGSSRSSSTHSSASNLSHDSNATIHRGPEQVLNFTASTDAPPLPLATIQKPRLESTDPFAPTPTTPAAMSAAVASPSQATAPIDAIPQNQKSHEESPPSPPSSERAILVPLNGMFNLHQVDLSQRMTIGRSNGVNVPDRIVFESMVISRAHACVWWDNGKVYLQDLGSARGTFVNSKRLSAANAASDPIEIRSGDVLQLGTDHGLPGSTEEPPSINRCVKIQMVLIPRVQDTLLLKSPTHQNPTPQPRSAEGDMLNPPWSPQPTSDTSTLSFQEELDAERQRLTDKIEAQHLKLRKLTEVKRSTSGDTSSPTSLDRAGTTSKLLISTTQLLMAARASWAANPKVDITPTGALPRRTTLNELSLSQDLPEAQQVRQTATQQETDASKKVRFDIHAARMVITSVWSGSRVRRLDIEIFKVAQVGNQAQRQLIEADLREFDTTRSFTLRTTNSEDFSHLIITQVMTPTSLSRPNNQRHNSTPTPPPQPTTYTISTLKVLEPSTSTLSRRMSTTTRKKTIGVITQESSTKLHISPSPQASSTSSSPVVMIPWNLSIVGDLTDSLRYIIVRKRAVAEPLVVAGRDNDGDAGKLPKGSSPVLLAGREQKLVAEGLGRSLVGKPTARGERTKVHGIYIHGWCATTTAAGTENNLDHGGTSSSSSLPRNGKFAVVASTSAVERMLITAAVTLVNAGLF